MGALNLHQLTGIIAINMKKIFRSIIRSLLAGFLAILGISCGKNEEELLVMYGTPNANIEVKARIVDQKGRPVKGAKLYVRYSKPGSYMGQFNPGYISSVWNPSDHSISLSDDSGGLKGMSSSYSVPRDKCTYLVFHKSMNGGSDGLSDKYENDSILVSPKKIESGDGGWYLGKYLLEGTLTLKEKSTDTSDE